MPVLFRAGLAVEDRVISKLESYGFRILREERLDHRHKLDFLVTGFPESPALVGLGVQLTTRPDELMKLREFWEKNRESKVTKRNIYIELEDKLDLEEGGAWAIACGLSTFFYSKDYADFNVLGLRIYPDLTSKFYDLEARIRQLGDRQIPAAPARPTPIATPTGVMPSAIPAQPKPKPPTDCSGILETWYSKGKNGYIRGKDEVFFFHYNYVHDEELRSYLDGLGYSEAATALAVPVEYLNAGMTKPGVKYKEARNVAIANGTR